MPGEFQIIQQYFEPLCGPEALALQDDAAYFSPPDGFDLIITKDLLLEGVHFRQEDPVELIAHKALAVNVSDCVSKGARPHAYFLGLALPADVNEDWLGRFSSGLEAAQRQFGCHLAGGDTTKTGGPLTISITLVGLVPTGRMIKRSGAAIGDDVYVTGALGDGALGLWCLQNDELQHGQLVSAYQKPQPATRIGPELIGLANASADVSDGLLADIGHIANASGVGIQVFCDKLPASEQGIELIKRQPDLKWTQWAGGDDYQIVFSAPKTSGAKLLEAAARSETRISLIGEVYKGKGVQMLDKLGKIMQVNSVGYTHF